ncbi:MAG: hypothetical protein ACJAQ4_002058 [Cryomorphaceae bacterium]|jgi:hypothetical protein
MKYLAVLMFGLFAFSAGAQEFIKKRVVSEEGIPLPYATVRLLPGNMVAIANEDAFFSISKAKLNEAESILISHLGYESLELKSTTLEKLPIVALKESFNELSQVNVLADTDKRWAEIIFQAFEKRRSGSMNEKATGKLTVRSYLKEQPIEILEGEGIVNIDNTGVPDDLTFSFVQTNIDPTNELQFFSIHTSALIGQFSPFERSEVSSWPLHPGRLGKRSIYKYFKIDLVKYNHLTGISEFELTSKIPEFLSATIWLYEEENTILRYEVFGEDLGELPIESIIKGKSIVDFAMRLTFDFGSESSRLNYLLWNYSFNYGTGQRINTLVKMPVENGQIELPVFLRKAEYHDYAMAAILPKPTNGVSEEITLSRSLKDIKALETLQTGRNSLDVGLIFWDRNKPFDIDQVPENEDYRKDSFDALGSPSRVASLKGKFQLSFNSVIYKTGNGDYGHRAFFEKINSAIPKMDDREVDLLGNLLFDEYQYAAQRISTGSTKENVADVTKSEQKELQLRKDRLLINSKGGSDLSFLLERNFANYELHGIDRFHQLNQLIFDSWMFDGFDPHINPASKEDLAMAYLIIGDYDRSLKTLKTITEKNASSIYLEALNYYFKNQCDESKRLLNKAKQEGFKVPMEAEALCS